MRHVIRSVVFLYSVLMGADAWSQTQYSSSPTFLDHVSNPAPLSGVTLSSTGRYVAGFEAGGDQQLLKVWRAEDDPKTGADLEIFRHQADWIGWVGGDQLVINTTDQALFLYQAETRSLRPLFATDSVPARGVDSNILMVSPMSGDADEILLQWAETGSGGFPSVFAVDLKTGRAEKRVDAWQPVVRWFASSDGVVSLGEGYEGQVRIHYARDSAGGWHVINRHDVFTDPQFIPLAVETGGKTGLVLTSHQSDTHALWRFRLSDGQFIRRLAGDERFDIDGVIMDQTHGLAIGASLIGDVKTDIYWRAVDDRKARSAAFEAGATRAIYKGQSRDGTRTLYGFGNENTPGWFGVYVSELDPLSSEISSTLHEYGKSEGHIFPQFDVQTVHINVGVPDKDMPAVLATPIDGGNGQAVIIVHGGPVSRVDEAYRPLTSWLVSNGYTVLSPNFRGSSGFGEKWRRAGYNEWGGVMQDDVSHAARWLLDRGIAEKGKLCALGGSYGGYAAVMAVIRDYNLFDCAVSLNGVMSLPDLVSAFSRGRFSALSLPRINDGISAKALRKLSPLFRASLVQRPVLLLHGSHDKRVHPSHSAEMARALRRHKKMVKFVNLKGARHVIGPGPHRKKYFMEIAAFLAAHMTPDWTEKRAGLTPR